MSLEKLKLEKERIHNEMYVFDRYLHLSDSVCNSYIDKNAPRIIVCGQYFELSDMLKKAYPEKYENLKRVYAESIDKMEYDLYRSLAIELDKINNAIATFEKYNT